MSVRPANPTPACATYVINAVIVPTRTPREAAERWEKRRGGEQEPHGHRGGLVDHGDQRAGVRGGGRSERDEQVCPHD